MKRPIPNGQSCHAVVLHTLGNLLFGWFMMSGLVAIAAAAESSPSQISATVKSLVDKYCVECHDGNSKKGGLDLESVSDDDFISHTATWEQVARKMRTRQMPPVGRDRPTGKSYDDAVMKLTATLDRAAAKHPNPGRTETFRRLNRTEYQNAIRDLLALEIDAAAWLPKDEVNHGFDNIEVANLSPTLLNRYIAAAEKISRLAVGAPGRAAGGDIFRIPADVTQEEHVAGLPLGTRGGTLISYTFPRDGEYEIQLRLARDRNEEVEGLRESHEVLVLIDREQVKSFTVAPPGSDRNFEKVDAHLKFRLPVAAGPHEVGVTFAKNPSSLLETRRQPYQAHYNMHRHPRLTPALYQVSINGPYDSKSAGDTPSRRRIFVSYPSKPEEQDTNGAGGLSPSPLNRERAGVRGGSGQSASPVSTVSRSDHPSPSIPLPVERSRKPEDTPRVSSRTAETTDEDACAEKILSTLMRRAYRRPVTSADLEKPMEFYQNAKMQGGFEAGIESALSAVLVSPEFLFRIEPDPAGVASNSVYRISDLILASRLSFFLWSSIPDDELLAAAERGELHKPRVLEKQVRRMLADSRSENLVQNFAEQWLHLRNLESITPDLRLFPDFDDNLRQAFRRETEMHFETVLREDRSVLDLLKADYTFVNGRLAKHYGIPNVYGSRFRRVALGKNSERGGLLRQGSVLTVTSYATRTSPVIRGKWVLENLVGTPPPPPLPDVPALMDNTVAANLSVRARLAEHRANAACASCHNLMDPIGLALEQYDAIGRWRTLEDGLPIDATGGLPDGSKFNGVAGLEAGLLKRPDIFVSTLTEKLMTFALGRGVESYDAPAVRKVVHDAQSNNYRFSAIILGIVNSTPFQMRKSL